VGFAAEARFELTKKTYDELVGIRIPGGKAQAAAVQRKLNLINKLKEELKAVIIYDDGFQIVAALSLQGKALAHMYQSLMSAPVPPGLKPEELKAYLEGVETQVAGPFKTQAVEVLELAVKRGHELQAYNDALIEAHRTLAGLRGDHSKDIDLRVKLTSVVDTLGVQ
jgi:hypothetical protein